MSISDTDIAAQANDTESHTDIDSGDQGTVGL